MFEIASVNRHVFQFYSDVFMNIGTQAHVLEQLEVENHETYMYSFDYCNPESWGILGYKMPFKGRAIERVSFINNRTAISLAATHCTELAYLFNVGIVMDFKFNDEDKVMLEMMSKMWTNFAKYG
jgi:carboxylesterase type B